MKNLFLIALTQLAFTTGQEGYGKCEILGFHNSSLLWCDTMQFGIQNLYFSGTCLLKYTMSPLRRLQSWYKK